MNTLTRTAARMAGGMVASVLAVAMGAVVVSAQDTTTTTVRHGRSGFDTEVRNAEVVYAEGNDLVLKLENGRVEHLVVPDSDTFTIDGSEVSVHEVRPGTTLTHTITTTTAPRYVTTVRTLKGRVWHVNPHASSVILTVPGGKNQTFKIPRHATLTIDGQPKTVFDLRKGMEIEATIVTDDTHTVVERSKSFVGQTLTPPDTPSQVGVLLIAEPTSLEAPATVASTEQLASTLPRTGTFLPFAGLLGALAVAMSVGLGAVRETRTS